MPNGENQHDLIGRQPTIFGNVAVAAARKNQLAAPLFSRAPEQWVFGEQFKRPADAQQLFTRTRRVLAGNEIEQALQVAKRSRRYFDPRHARARGRRTFSPATLASR